MTRMLLLMLSLLAVGCLLTGTLDAQSTKHPPCTTSLKDCKLSGCGGDVRLSRKKNRKDAATSPEAWTIAQLIDLNEESPKSWKIGRDRTPLAALGEGKPVVVKGWLISAHTTKTPEACNCYLKEPDYNDIHLDLVPHKNDSPRDGIVAEITPRFRPDGWTEEKLAHLGDEITYVRVTGWLLFDSAHPRPSESRATAWEVHPVTKFEVCTGTKKQCDMGTGWQKLEDYKIP